MTSESETLLFKITLFPPSVWETFQTLAGKPQQPLGIYQQILNLTSIWGFSQISPLEADILFFGRHQHHFYSESSNISTLVRGHSSITQLVDGGGSGDDLGLYGRRNRGWKANDKCICVSVERFKQNSTFSRHHLKFFDVWPWWIKRDIFWRILYNRCMGFHQYESCSIKSRVVEP